MEEGLRYIRSSFGLEEADAAMYSPLVLAYIGDAVYELIIRTVVVGAGNRAVNKLHKTSEGMVKATAQSEIVRLIADELDSDEKAIFKRGRNATSHSVAKNASISEYRYATGFEALIGYLYLEGRYERAVDLVRSGLERRNQKSGEDRENE